MRSLIFAAPLLLSGCAAGFAFSAHGTPLGALYAEAASNEQVSDNAIGTKTGEACAKSILGLITLGDASVATAARAAGIAKISVIDHNVTNILGVYATYCVVVHGE
jgi:hypothetical protein